LRETRAELAGHGRSSVASKDDTRANIALVLSVLALIAMVLVNMLKP
jgi:hypothetical protein